MLVIFRFSSVTVRLMLSSTVDKPQSLADLLGVQDPQQPDFPVAPSPKMTAKAFCKDIINTVQYRESLLRRIVMDTLPSAVECMLWDRAHGKTVEKVEVKDTSAPLERLTSEELLKRAEFLATLAEQLRQAQAAEPARVVDIRGSVH